MSSRIWSPEDLPFKSEDYVRLKRDITFDKNDKVMIFAGAEGTVWVCDRPDLVHVSFTQLSTSAEVSPDDLELIEVEKCRSCGFTIPPWITRKFGDRLPKKAKV